MAGRGCPGSPRVRTPSPERILAVPRSRLEAQRHLSRAWLCWGRPFQSHVT